MTSELFVDTSGWFGLADPRDAAHPRLKQALEERVRGGAPIVTSNLVIAETYALLMRRIHRSAALAFLQEVGRPPNRVVTSTTDHEARAQRDWLERYTDQDFSFTDAVSFVVMEERGIREVLGLDRRFADAGFQLLPAPS